MEYWETRYKNGGNSGKGSRGLIRLWKWLTIWKYVGVPRTSLLDVGCGDLAFWTGLKMPDGYLGVDISETQTAKNMCSRPRNKFVTSDARYFVSSKLYSVVFCFDVLFHIRDEKSYQMILETLAASSAEWIFIYTWWRNPFPGKEDDGQYQRYRDFTGYFDLMKKQKFNLVGFHKNRFDPVGAMYVFRREE
jgi:hypothetical protein